MKSAGSLRKASMGIKPNIGFDLSPMLPPYSAQWGLRHFLKEIYFKRSHFQGLGANFGRDAYHVLDAQLHPYALAQLVQDERDLVEEVIDRVQGGVQRSGSAPSVPDLVTRWLRSETTLNARLSLACALMNPEACATTWASLLPWPDAPHELFPARLSGWLDGRRRDWEFGQPDLLLVGSHMLVMVEMKVRGGASAEKYGPDQLVKYMNLARFCHERLGIERICHLILTPQGGSTPFVHRDEWIASIDRGDGRLTFDTAGLAAAASKQKWRKRLLTGKGMADLEAMLKKVPVLHVHYDLLAERGANQAARDIWHRSAQAQLQRLNRDAEPHASPALAELPETRTGTGDSLQALRFR